MWMTRGLTILVMAGTLRAGAQQAGYERDSKWEKVCAAAKAQPIAIPKIEHRGLEACDETALYYGISGKPDYVAALKCGWYERAHPQETVGNMFYGPGVLAMLYANGQGVRRDYDLAIRFACEETWAAEVEMELRIGHLEYLRDNKIRGTSFDLCDDITSGLSMGTCTRVGTDTREFARESKVKAFENGLALNARKAFAKLREAEKKFEEDRGANEVDLSGTARGMFVAEDEDKLREQFLINLQRFAKQDIPAANTRDLAALDAALNSTYKRIQSAPVESMGTVTAGGVRLTERSWLELVSAWEDFGRVAYPKLSSTQIRAQLVRLRLHQLRAIVPAE